MRRCVIRAMGTDDALLIELGVTARGERDVARDVIRDAALAAAAREAARRAPAAAGDAVAGDGGVVSGDGDARGGPGGGGGASGVNNRPSLNTPATHELRRLREEAARVDAELATVRDALDDVQTKLRDGTAAADAPLVIAVGERRVAGLVEKHNNLRTSVLDAETAVHAEKALAQRNQSSTGDSNGVGTSSKKAPPPSTTLDEDDDLDALLDSISTGAPKTGSNTDNNRRTTSGVSTSTQPEPGETERERLIRTGVLTPFAALSGFERRVRGGDVTSDAATEHAVRSTQAWRAGRSKAMLLEGDNVPKQHPAARPFQRQGGSRAADVANGVRMAEKRKEWRSKQAENANGSGQKKRRKRRQRDAAYSSDDKEEEDVNAESEEEPVVAPAPVRSHGRRARASGRVKTEPTAPSARASTLFVIPKREPSEAGLTSRRQGTIDTPVATTTGRWACPACTFANTSGRTCELCETPRQEASPNTEADASDNDVEFVGEVVAPAAQGVRGTRAKHKPQAWNKNKAPLPVSAPPPRRAAEVAQRNAGRAAQAEAEELSVSGSGSEYDNDDDETDDDEDLELEEEEVVEEPVVAVPRRGRTPVGGRGRGGSSGGTDRASGRPAASTRPHSRRTEPAPSDSDSEEEEIVFDGGLHLLAEVYDRLLEHQKTSLKWLWELHCQRAGGIIGDEMGLGKTVQVSAFLNALERSGLYKPTLVVCPATMLRQWRRELKIWAPKLRPTILHESAVSAAALAASSGDKKQARRVLLRNCVNNSKGILLTTYEHLRVMRDSLLQIKWGYAILDEGHKIRNPDADITIVVKQLQTVHRIIMTGAPIQNRLSELWSLFDFCFPGKLGTLPVFQAEFAVPIQVGGYSNGSEQQVVTAFRCATTLKNLISPFLLRRMKCDVNIQLPKKTEQVLFCPMTNDQKQSYRAFVNSRDVEEILEGRREALSGIDVLRKIVNHPDLLERRTKAAHADYGNETRSGKLIVTMKVLQLWRQQKHRVLLFSQTQQMLDILEAACSIAGYNYRRMDGQTPVQHRMRLIDEFNTDEDVFVFLLTTKVGGLGVNLTGADRVLLFDPDWNPSTDAQARERAWRIGQTKAVTVYRLVTAGTIEEKVYHRQIYKEFLTSKVLRDPKQKRFFKAKDLADLFQWEEDGERGGGDAGIETAELFAEVDGELHAKDFGEDMHEDGEMHEGSGDAHDPWDPNCDPSASRRKNKTHAKPNNTNSLRMENVPSTTTDTTQTPGDGDAAIMRTLFGVGGEGSSNDSGMIRGAMNHDAIIGASGSKDHLVGGSAAAEAERVARRAHQAVTQSGRQRLQSNVAVPTWTGRSGAAGAPVEMGARNGRGRGGGRFGRSRQNGVAEPSADEIPGGVVAAGVMGSSSARVGTGGSQTLLQRIRIRDANAAAAAGSGAIEPTDPSSGPSTEETEATAEALLRDVVSFLGARPFGRAPTGLVVDAFQDRLESNQHALFRRLLKVAATLEKNPPNAAGRGGGASWVLKEEFR